MNIKKRDETLEIFDINKIKNALLKAFTNTNIDNPNIDDILNHINNELLTKNTNIYQLILFQISIIIFVAIGI
jgi:transcriptional regulator NrdR family protein